MKTINATLLASQKVPTGQAYATATLADNSRLHPVLVATGSASGGNTIGCECGSFYMRLRYVSAVLTVQKITDPTVASQWTTWTAFQAFEAGTTNGIAIFWTGNNVVICWQDFTATGSIKYRRSSDGVTFSAPAVAHAGSPGVNINISGLSTTIANGANNGGIVLSYAKRVHFRKYNDGADTWGAADDNGFDLTDVVPIVAGFQDGINSRYILAVETNTFVSWATYAIVLFTRAVGAATWSAGQVIFATNATQHFKGMSFSQRQVNGLWWFIFTKPLQWTTLTWSNMLVSVSDDGLFWEDPSPTAVLGSGISLCLLPAPAGGAWTNAYLANELSAYRLDTYAYWTAQVINYSFSTGHGASEMAPTVEQSADELIINPLLNKHGKPVHKPHPSIVVHNPGAATSAPSQGRLIIQLDNRDGSLTSPRIFSVLTVTRGLQIGGVNYGVSAGTWYVIAFRYTLQDQILELQATDAHGLLATWFSHNVFTYNGQTVKTLVEQVCALAGVHTVTFDAFAGWTDVVHAFGHPVLWNAHYSLRSLATRIPFEFLAKEDGSLYFYVPTAAPASVYTYGSAAGQHTMWPGSFGAHESVAYIQVAGGAPRTMVAEAMDNTAIYDTGRKSASIINQRALTVDTQATALANAALVAAQERKHGGVFDAPPNFALEPGDVISFGAGSVYASGTGPWRVEQFDEHFNMVGARPFFQKITVRGTA